MDTMRALAVILLVAGCYPSNETCEGLVCPEGLVCAPAPYSKCVLPQQLTPCGDKGTGDACEFEAAAGQQNGFCYENTCVTGIGTCGDGHVDEHEECDCGELPTRKDAPIGCTSLNGDASSCHLGCRIPRCGDMTKDPGEVCEDGNNRSGDGCRADCQGRFEKLIVPSQNHVAAVWTPGQDQALVVCGNGVDHNAYWYDAALTPPWKELGGLGAKDDWFASVWGPSANEIYVGGATLGEVFHTTAGPNGTWTAIPLESPGLKTVTAIAGRSASEVFVAGVDATDHVHVFQLVNGSFALLAVGGCPAMTNVPLDPSSVAKRGPYLFVGSSGVDVTWLAQNTDVICHYSAGSWTQDRRLTGPVAGDAVGTYMLALVARQLFEIRPVTPPPTDIPATGAADLAVTSSKEILVVSDAGRVLRFDRATSLLEDIPTPTEQHLLDISATSENNVFILGADGALLH
jgi:cysteine-rich repeat protein